MKPDGILVYGDKPLPVQPRGCGKTNLHTAYLLAWCKSNVLEEPVPLSHGYELLNEMYND